MIILVVIVVLVAAAILIPLGIWLGRRSRGALAIQTPNHQLRPGEAIEGFVQVTAKRNLGPGRLTASLVCTEEWREWVTDSDGDRTRKTRREEAYRYDAALDHELLMEAGTTQVAPYVFQAPHDRRQTTRQPDSTFGRLMVSLGEMGSRNSEFIWEIESRYAIPGLDLRASERINLHLEL